MCVWPERLRGCVRATHRGAKGIVEGLCEVTPRVGPGGSVKPPRESDIHVVFQTLRATAFFEASTRDLVHGWKGGSRALLGHATRLVIGSEARGGRVRMRGRGLIGLGLHEFATFRRVWFVRIRDKSVAGRNSG